MNINFLSDDSAKFNKNDSQNKEIDESQAARFIKPKTEEEVVDVVPEMYKNSSEDMFDEKKSGAKTWWVLLIIIALAGLSYGAYFYWDAINELFTSSSQSEAVEELAPAIIDSAKTELLEDSIDSQNSANIDSSSALTIPTEILSESSKRQSISKIAVDLFALKPSNIDIEHITLQGNDILVEVKSANKSNLNSFVQTMRNSNTSDKIGVISEGNRNNQATLLFSIMSTFQFQKSYTELLDASGLEANLRSLLNKSRVLEFEQENFSGNTVFIIRANATVATLQNVLNQTIEILNNSKFVKFSIISTPDNVFQLNMMIQLLNE